MIEKNTLVSDSIIFKELGAWYKTHAEEPASRVLAAPHRGLPSNVAQIADACEGGKPKDFIDIFLNSTGDVFPHTWGINSVGEYLFAG